VSLYPSRSVYWLNIQRTQSTAYEIKRAHSVSYYGVIESLICKFHIHDFRNYECQVIQSFCIYLDLICGAAVEQNFVKQKVTSSNKLAAMVTLLSANPTCEMTISNFHRYTALPHCDYSFLSSVPPFKRRPNVSNLVIKISSVHYSSINCSIIPRYIVYSVCYWLHS